MTRGSIAPRSKLVRTIAAAVGAAAYLAAIALAVQVIPPSTVGGDWAVNINIGATELAFLALGVSCTAFLLWARRAAK